jgi:hypothetical protein
MKTPLRTLTTAEQGDLNRLEGIVTRGLAGFVEVGKALLEIHGRKLYRATHKLWDRYCKARWKIARSQAYRLMDGARVIADLLETSPVGETLPLPDSERVARPLAGVPAGQQRRMTWENACRDANGQPTAEDVEAAVMAGFSEAEREQVLNGDRRPARKADTDVRTRRIMRGLKGLGMAGRALARVEDLEEEMELLAELIERVEGAL